MTHIHPEGVADIEFSLRWKSGAATHTDNLYAPRVNFWRDCFPGDMRSQLMGGETGHKATVDCSTADFGQHRDPRRKLNLKASQFRRGVRAGGPRPPRAGRFYPQGLLSGVPGVFAANVRPFRCTDAAKDKFDADLNHPLAGYPLTLAATVKGIDIKSHERGGGLTDWLEATSEGPGMQVRHNGKPTDFLGKEFFSRRDESADAEFYRRPRMVQHLDGRARAEIGRLHGRLFKESDALLDLMASWSTHLPRDFPAGSMTGLGMNEAELAANSRLARRQVQDLNRQPRLPFADNEFDGVMCTASVEYLVHPVEVFSEVARVTRPGGLFVVSFSNRWFAPKAIRIWQEIHEFERMGLVLEYFVQSGKFHGLETFSMRGLPRPADDKYYPEKLTSDPVYAVWGAA